MPKKTRQKPNEPPTQKQKLTPLKAAGEGLILVGKPLYFVFSRLIIGIIFCIYFIGHLTNGSIELILKKLRQKKPNFFPFLKLEWLKINLFELNILTNLKSFLKTKRLSKKTKFKIKFRILFIVPVLFLLILILSFYFLILRGLPSPHDLDKRTPDISTKIYDRNGVLLYKIYKSQNRTIIPLTNIPEVVRFATLAAEDAEFYSHPGFSVRGIFRAFVSNVNTGTLQGGSTITQQLVKNTLLTPEKTITRKIKELILSVEVEGSYTKDKILEMYLNEVSYGGTAYGVEEASRSYFGKDVADLDLAEAAFLAGLPKSPTLFSPFGQNPDLSFARQREVLHLMKINRYISEEQEKKAAQEKLSFSPNRTEIKAPHFVMYIRQLLVDKYGEDLVEKGGLEVKTSLDYNIESLAENVVASEVEKLKGLNVGNGAALVVSPETGEILAMVGSKDYFDTKHDGNVNVLLRLRQPGSSIKVVNYIYALSHGYTPASIIDDSPITYVTPGSTPYSPVNYDGKFVGKITLRNALAQSRNIPAVKVLASYGVTKMIEQGSTLGITTWTDPSQYGLSLTLGGGAVKGIDLVKVYATLADYGNRPNFLPILEVKDYKGKVFEKNFPTKTEKVMDARIAFTLIDILKDNFARAPEFGLNSSLVIKDHPEVAVKTGTSNDLRDNWTVGFNQNYLVLTWVGNNNNSPMGRIASGITGAAPIWNKIMSAILSGKESIDWKVPDGISKVNICSITGTLPCNSCPTKQEWFLDEARPKKSCTQSQIQNILNPTPIPIGNKILEGASTVNR